jgi:hypothetical protein
MTRNLGMAVVALALAACGDGGLFVDDCGGEMGDARNAFGPPERSTSYDSGSYHSVTYWWYKRGVSKTFTWGNGQDCKVTDFRFTPIR